jgi:hypothetical protein
MSVIEPIDLEKEKPNLMKFQGAMQEPIPLHHKHKTSLSEHGKSISQCHCLLNCSFFRGSHWPRTGITTPRKRTQRLHG